MSQREQLVLNIRGVSLDTSQFRSWRNQVFHWRPSPHGECFADSFDIISLQSSTHVTESHLSLCAWVWKNLAMKKSYQNIGQSGEFIGTRKDLLNKHVQRDETMNKNKMAALIERRLFFVPKFHSLKPLLNWFMKGGSLIFYVLFVSNCELLNYSLIW